MKMQTTIAITSGALVISALMFLVGKTLWPELEQFATDIVTTIDFPDFVLEGVLGFLLFADGLGTNLQALKSQRWEITVLVLLGVLTSTVLVAAGLWGLCWLPGVTIPFTYCLLFGELISPADPIVSLVPDRVG
jgi:CPA1 family monovalent cation:H+ antiporter